MRLLDSRTLRLVEFFGASIPKYAILSHRWEDEEVSLQDMQTGVAKDKKGYRKIESCCRRARLDGHEWVWIDTCCIDKTSSAELSEAINSMFRWYQRAWMCYAYLSDVRNETAGYQGEAWRLLDAFTLRALNDSLWFTRGWTLQELIAPDEVTFYDKDWCKIGTKTDLKETLSSITGIHVSVLGPWFRVDSFSIAQRMSWASNRQTTRTEDMAYCLLGNIWYQYASPIRRRKPSFYPVARRDHETFRRSFSLCLAIRAYDPERSWSSCGFPNRV